jgi:hypothetical protein
LIDFLRHLRCHIVLLTNVVFQVIKVRRAIIEELD